LASGPGQLRGEYDLELTTSEKWSNLHCDPPYGVIS